MVVASEEKRRLRSIRRDREDIDRLERILRENPEIIPVEVARIQLIIDDLKRKVAA